MEVIKLKKVDVNDMAMNIWLQRHKKAISRLMLFLAASGIGLVIWSNCYEPEEAPSILVTCLLLWVSLFFGGGLFGILKSNKEKKRLNKLWENKELAVELTEFKERERGIRASLRQFKELIW